jgi:hypothetical protein
LRCRWQVESRWTPSARRRIGICYCYAWCRPPLVRSDSRPGQRPRRPKQPQNASGVAQAGQGLPYASIVSRAPPIGPPFRCHGCDSRIGQLLSAPAKAIAFGIRHQPTSPCLKHPNPCVGTCPPYFSANVSPCVFLAPGLHQYAQSGVPSVSGSSRNGDQAWRYRRNAYQPEDRP